MIVLEINNQAKVHFNQKLLTKTVQQAGRLLKVKDRKIVSLALVSKKEIQKLNKDYRGIDQPTDVLSFAQSKSKLPQTKETKNYLGEIIICYLIAKKQAQDNKVGIQEELARLLVHGLLHLTGHHHKTAVKRKKNEELTKKILGF